MRRRLLNSILPHDDIFINLKSSRRYMSDFRLLDLDKYKQLDDTENSPVTNLKDSKIYKKFIVSNKKRKLKNLNTTNYSVNRLVVQDIKLTNVAALNQDITTSLSNCLKLMKINSEPDNHDPFSFKFSNNNITKLQNLQNLNIPIISNEKKKDKNLKNLPDIIPIKPMKFDESDFEVSESTLRKYPFSIAVSNNPLINKETEPVKTFKRLKGVSYELYKIGSTSVSKPIFKSNLFSLTYYHPNHFMSKIRKSKPGIWISAQTNVPYNNETLITKGKNSNSNSNININKSPFKLAVNRTKLRKLIKKLFFKNYLELNAPDGFYNFKFRKFPKDEKDQELLKSEITKALSQVKYTDISVFLNAVKFADNRIDWKLVDSTCRKFQLSKIVPHFSNNINNKKRK